MDNPPCKRVEIFHDRPERERREVRECTYDEHDKNEPDNEERAVIAESTVADWNNLLYNKRSRECDGDDSNSVAPDKHCECCGKIVKDAVGRQTAESAAIVLGSRAERIQDLRKPVWSGVEDGR
jgi:hypothetical protein